MIYFTDFLIFLFLMNQNSVVFRLESLRTLILTDNLLTRIQLSTDDVPTLDQVEDAEWSLVGVAKSRLIFPNLSMLDISNNSLKVSV
jgi:Leucine-rich repeat (LRR) protein